METPALDKLKAIQPQSQAVGEFLDWLTDKAVMLCEPHRHSKKRCGWAPDEKKTYVHKLAGKDGDIYGYDCGMTEGRMYPVARSTESWLAEFFEIDLDAVGREKLAILESLRTAQEVVS